MDIGDRIKQIRIDRGMTQEELAKKAHTSRQNICRYEKNVLKDVPMSRIVAIAEALDTTPAVLLGYSEDEKNARQRIHKAIDELPDDLVRLIELLVDSYPYLSPQQIEAYSVLLSVSRNNPEL